MQAITAPAHQAQICMDSVQESHDEYIHMCWLVGRTLSKLVRLVMELVALAFTDVQRRMFQQRGCHELAMAYGAAFHALDRGGKLFSDSESRINSTEARLAAHVVHLGRLLYEDCPELPHTPIRSEIPLRPLENLWMQDASDASDPSLQWLRLTQLMIHLGIRQRCGAPSCLATTFDGALKRCTRRQRIQYCSRACQRLAWQHSLVPHRGVCNALHEMCKES